MGVELQVHHRVPGLANRRQQRAERRHPPCAAGSPVAERFDESPERRDQDGRDADVERQVHREQVRGHLPTSREFHAGAKQPVPDHVVREAAQL